MINIEILDTFFSGSINDLIYLVTGFLSIKIFDYLANYKRKFVFYELIIYSAIITISSFYVHDVLLGNNLQHFIILPLIVPIIISGVLGYILKKYMRKNVSRQSVWDTFRIESFKKYVKITTKNGDEIYGWVSGMDLDNQDSNNDIILRDPFVYNKNKTNSLGKMVYFSNHSIDHIILCTEVWK